jgi:hypothetical protein
MAHPDLLHFMGPVRVVVGRHGLPREKTDHPTLVAAANYANAFLPADQNLLFVSFDVILHSQVCNEVSFGYAFRRGDVVDVFDIQEMLTRARQSLVGDDVHNL